MNCPRCGAALRECGPNRRWRPYFECRECCRAFEMVNEQHMEPCGHNPRAKFLRHSMILQPGRTRKPNE
jgi:transposase-like protein